MNLVIIRGLPGSGKSTMAKEFVKLGYKHFEADQYFEKDGVYKFTPENLWKAHDTCQYNTFESLRKDENVVVANTFTTKKEIQPYLNIAKEFGATVFIMEATGNFGSIHNVPETSLEKMRQRWEKF